MAAGVRLGARRSAKLADMIAGQKRTFDVLEEARRTTAPEGFDLWVHAASLGEFEQARPVIEAYRSKRPEAKILLTFFSPSGYNVRHDYDRVDCVAYLPFDTPANARRFVVLVRPRAVMFVKYEFWGNFLSEIRRRDIPLYLISAIFRPGQSFFKSWGGTFRAMLPCYTHIFVQDEDSRRLLETIGVTNVTVAGDTRFDRVVDIAGHPRELPAVRAWADNDEFAVPGAHRGPRRPFTLVAGSSWPADEEYYIPWLNAHPQVHAIIAPHEFDDRRLEVLQRSLTGKSVFLSTIGEDGKIAHDTQVLIADCYGLLSSLYQFADAAIIGGGLGAGIHNINEAAVYGIPVAFGPNHAKFKEALDLRTAHGRSASGATPMTAASVYANAAQCRDILERWLTDAEARKEAGAAARHYIYTHTGATPKILKVLLP